ELHHSAGRHPATAAVDGGTYAGSYGSGTWSASDEGLLTLNDSQGNLFAYTKWDNNNFYYRLDGSGGFYMEHCATSVCPPTSTRDLLVRDHRDPLSKTRLIGAEDVP